MPSTEGRPLRVLVVDDSALVREVVQRIFAGDDSFAITTAADPLIAARKMAVTRPDVILLDLAMPQMDGLSFLRKVMAEDPIPVVVCSSMTGDAPEMAMRALGEGALDVVTKPRVGVRGFLEESFTLLVDTLRAAAQASVARRTPLAMAKRPVARSPGDAVVGAAHRPVVRPQRALDRALVAIGASSNT